MNNNFKEQLYNLCHKSDLPSPKYKLVSVHNNKYEVKVIIGRQSFYTPVPNNSKSLAEQEAARIALRILSGYDSDDTINDVYDSSSDGYDSSSDGIDYLVESLVDVVSKQVVDYQYQLIVDHLQIEEDTRSSATRSLILPIQIDLTSSDSSDNDFILSTSCTSSDEGDAIVYQDNGSGSDTSTLSSSSFDEFSSGMCCIMSIDKQLTQIIPKILPDIPDELLTSHTVQTTQNNIDSNQNSNSNNIETDNLTDNNYYLIDVPYMIRTNRQSSLRSRSLVNGKVLTFAYNNPLADLSLNNDNIYAVPMSMMLISYKLLLNKNVKSIMMVTDNDMVRNHVAAMNALYNVDFYILDDL